MAILPAEVSTATVTGYLTQAVGNLEGAVPEMRPLFGSVTFTPNVARAKYPLAAPNPFVLTFRPIVATLGNDGFLRGPDGVAGVVIPGTGDKIASYTVTFEVSGDYSYSVTTVFPSGSVTDIAEILEIPSDAGAQVPDAWLSAVNATSASAAAAELSATDAETARAASVVAKDQAVAAMATKIDTSAVDAKVAADIGNPSSATAGANDTATAGYISTTGTSETKTALDARYAQVIALAGRGVSAANSGAANRAAIQSAVDAAPYGSVVVFPATASGAWITVEGSVTVPSGLTVRGAGPRNTRIRQTLFPVPTFDAINPDVMIENIWFDQAPFTVVAADMNEYRGAAPKTAVSVGVYVAADNVRVRNCHGTNLNAVASFNAWDVTSGLARTQLLGCTADNLSIMDCVFGILVLGVKGFSFSRITGKYKLLTGITTAPHLVYFAQGRGTNYDVHGSDCHADSGEVSFAYQFKGVVGGEFDKLTARSSKGLLHVMEGEDVRFSNIAGYGDTWTDTLQASVDLETANNRITIDGVTLSMAGNGKPVRFDTVATNSVLKNANIISNHTADPGTGYAYDVDISGTGNSVDTVTTTNIGATPWDAGIGVWAGAGHTIRRPRTSGNKVGATIRAGASGDIVDYEPTALGSTLSKPLTLGGAGNVYRRSTYTARVGQDRVLAFDDGAFGAGSANTLTRAPSGQSWVQQFGTWTAVASRIWNTNAAAGKASAVIDAGQANVRVTAGVTVANREMVVARAVDANNLVGARLNQATQTFELVKSVAGAFTVLATVAEPVTVGRRYEISIVAFGNDIEGWVDGRRLLTFTLTGTDATTFTTTKHGLFAIDASGRFDNFTIRSLT